MPEGGMGRITAGWLQKVIKTLSRVAGYAAVNYIICSPRQEQRLQIWRSKVIVRLQVKLYVNTN